MLIPRRNNSNWFNHEHDGALGRARPMQHAFWNHHSLSRSQADGPLFQLDEQLPLHYVEEFVVRIVLMPVILAPDHVPDGPPIHSLRTRSGCTKGTGTRPRLAAPG